MTAGTATPTLARVTATGAAGRMLAALAERDGVEVERLALRLASAVLDAESYSGHHARAGGER